MITFSGKHLLIAGGSRGIGAATAVLAARAGAVVSIGYRGDHRAAQATVDRITAAGGRASAFAHDLGEAGAPAALVADAIRAHGDLDGLVVAAGVFQAADLADMSVGFWDFTMQVNLRASFLAIQAVIPSLRRRGGGSIVLYTSTAGQRGSEHHSAYAVSKGGQILLMRSAARELAGDRIRCNCVAPGWTDTDMAAGELDPASRVAVEKSIPLGRIGRPEEPASAALFLLSDLAAFITGSTITVDGGFDMRG
ncbi:short-chain dehydrogenase [Planctomycetota bacterium]|nr:short-chain dehydrogenase [Planctomycetota bacterium]